MPLHTNSPKERITTNQETIRAWIEERDGIPAVEPGTEAYRFVQLDEINEKNEPRDWDAFFEAFESGNLAFVYPLNADKERIDGHELIDRSEAVSRVKQDRAIVENVLRSGGTISVESEHEAPEMAESESEARSDRVSESDDLSTEVKQGEIRISTQDRGKKVFNEFDRDIGTVVDVDEKTLYVKPEPGLTDQIKLGLGFGVGERASDDIYAVNRSHIREITAERVIID